MRMIFASFLFIISVIFGQAQTVRQISIPFLDSIKKENPNLAIGATIDVLDSLRWIVITQSFNFSNYLLTTNDGGKSWKTQAIQLDTTFGNPEFLNTPNGVRMINDSTYFVGGVFPHIPYTTNYGKTWHNLSVTGERSRRQNETESLQFLGNDTICVTWNTRPNKIFVSTDRGITWDTTIACTLLENKPVLSSNALPLSISDSIHCWIVYNTDRINNFVITKDKGKTFENYSLGTSPRYARYTLVKDNKIPRRIWIIENNRVDTTDVFLTNCRNGLLYTDDFGKTITRVHNPEHFPFSSTYPDISGSIHNAIIDSSYSIFIGNVGKLLAGKNYLNNAQMIIPPNFSPYLYVSYYSSVKQIPHTSRFLLYNDAIGILEFDPSQNATSIIENTLHVDDNNFSISPMPVKDNFLVHSTGKMKNYKLLIRNMLGDVFFDDMIRFESSIVNCSQFSLGLYTITITDESGKVFWNSTFIKI